ncbi:HAD family hydrolase [Pseudochrobactrum sp. MP213Fo]|uniref:HAD family hydrolase n=1 Tax=Pseudochrobactrum sp. MP213Fo TaxID=3022250 RepID=UPI003B9F2786
MTQRDNSVFLRSYAGFLFDMDGTLVNSIPVVERIWLEWAAEQGLDGQELLKKVHGIRVVDIVKMLNMPHLDPETVSATFLAEEMRDFAGIRAIAGAKEFIASLPADRWTIVTSAPRELAEARLEAAGLPVPETIVTAEDVMAGKPDPSGYQLGAQRLGFDAADCLVFEDAPAGIAAGKAAHADVVMISETHSHVITGGNVDFRDFIHLGIMQDADGRLRLSV